MSVLHIVTANVLASATAFCMRSQTKPARTCSRLPAFSWCLSPALILGSVRSLLPHSVAHRTAFLFNIQCTECFRKYTHLELEVN
jgi:hypothetical protein